ncbi:MAG: hypothetical protein F6K30_25420 [Cyanothece sp. SIO2G6]|nr:hypothetical protein [Cyanothece sp. SIO2G6]
MNIYVNRRKVRVSDRSALGKGGEADVFKIGKDRALKVFKPPDHPDFAGIPAAQQAAADRLDQHQQKLRQFPTNLPDRVVHPLELATDATGQRVLGYTMPLLRDTEALLRYGDRAFRQSIATQTVVQIFQDLHRTLTQLHQAQVVIGDFNDLNVLVKDTQAHIIDADSFQFGAFFCSMFTTRFVDPLLCDRQANSPILQQKHTPESDWYAFTVMLMQCLLFVDPYGGIYKPKDKTQAMPHAARPLHRITVFHPEVRYPKPALPPERLSDDLLHHFHQVFEQDWRGELPRSLLDQLCWRTCPHCGIEYARSQCPECVATVAIAPIPGAIKVIQGQVTATVIAVTEGIFLHAVSDGKTLSWVEWQRGKFQREDGQCILAGELQSNLRWGIQGKATWIGQSRQLVRLQPQESPQRLAAESHQGVTQLAVNRNHVYWIDQGQLLRDQLIGGGLNQTSQVVIGNVLPGGHTRIWVGPVFGFGFYQAADLRVAFVFDEKRVGVSDCLQLPRWQGTLVHTACTFSNSPAHQNRGWLFLTTQEQGILHYRCIVLTPDGRMMATAHSQQGQDHWLSTLGDAGGLALDPAPHLAVNDFLLAPTDAGIIRIDIQNGHLVHTKTFVDTEPFVDAQCRILPAPAGLYIASTHRIQQLQLS